MASLLPFLTPNGTATAMACWDDVDCPGASVCAVHEAWVADVVEFLNASAAAAASPTSPEKPGLCLCNGLAGTTGPTCRTTCPAGVLRATLAAVAITLCVAVLGAGLTFVPRVVGALIVDLSARLSAFISSRTSANAKANAKPTNTTTPDVVIIKLDSVLLSSVTTTIAALFAMLAVGVQLGNTLAFSTFFRVSNSTDATTNTSRLVKDTPTALSGASVGLGAITLAIGLCAPLVLPLTWTRVARRSFAVRGIMKRTAFGWFVTAAYGLTFVLLIALVLLRASSRVDPRLQLGSAAVTGYCVAFVLLASGVALWAVRNMREVLSKTTAAAAAAAAASASNARASQRLDASAVPPRGSMDGPPPTTPIMTNLRSRFSRMGSNMSVTTEGSEAMDNAATGGGNPLSNEARFIEALRRIEVAAWANGTLFFLLIPFSIVGFQDSSWTPTSHPKSCSLRLGETPRPVIADICSVSYTHLTLPTN